MKVYKNGDSRKRAFEPFTFTVVVHTKNELRDMLHRMMLNYYTLRDATTLWKDYMYFRNAGRRCEGSSDILDMLSEEAVRQGVSIHKDDEN